MCACFLVSFKGKKVLTIDQVISMMVDLKNGMDWRTILRHVPSRVVQDGFHYRDMRGSSYNNDDYAMFDDAVMMARNKFRKGAHVKDGVLRPSRNSEDARGAASRPWGSRGDWPSSDRSFNPRSNSRFGEGGAKSSWRAGANPQALSHASQRRSDVPVGKRPAVRERVKSPFHIWSVLDE